MNLINIIWGLLTGKAGESVGGAVSSVAQIAAVIAAASSFGLWLVSNKNEVFITLTYGDLAFWGGIFCVHFLVLRLVHRATPPG